MSGLEKIIQQIEDEAKSSAGDITREAHENAAQILSEADKRCSEIAAQAAEQSKVSKENILNKGRSAAQMQRGRELLAAKQNVIRSIIDEAYQILCQLDEKEYFGLIRKMLEIYVSDGDGEIIFSPRDQARLPADFPAVAAEISAERGGTLTVSDQTREMDGGFLLVYGGVEVNCSFHAIFMSKMEYFQDIVHKFLFG